MLTKEELRNIVKQKIETDEKLGEQTGGSAHLGYTDYHIDEVQTSQLKNGNIKIRYNYTVFVETEFTYYPDNPPMEYPREKVIIVDENKKIISED